MCSLIIASYSFYYYNLEILVFTRTAFGNQPNFIFNWFKCHSESFLLWLWSFTLDSSVLWVWCILTFLEIFLKGCLAFASISKASRYRFLVAHIFSPPSPGAVEFYSPWYLKLQGNIKPIWFLFLCRNFIQMF